ncbi:MAG TPA: DUF4389 domain-containing protein [Woeseiaceae bacterium]|nr:DUF4389 domain-containing protein [Woeseiaceae bacterium]
MANEEQPRDHAGGGDDDVYGDPELDGAPGRGDVESNLKSRSTWLRLLFMIVLAFIYGISRVVVGAVVVLQFLVVLFTGEVNERLRVFGKSLSIYTCQLLLYLTYNTEERPFPFDLDWPE